MVMRLIIHIKKFSAKVQNVFTLILGSLPLCLDFSVISEVFKFFYANMLFWWIEFILFSMIFYIVWYIVKKNIVHEGSVAAAGRVLSHLLSVMFGFTLSLTLYAMSYTYSFEDYKNAVFDGKTETIALYYSNFLSEKDFFVKYENKNMISPSVLLWAIEHQHKNYQEVFSIARQNNFNVDYKFTFSYYTKFKNPRYRTVAYEKIFYAIGEFLGAKYGNQFTSSQYILALSDAEFTSEFLEFLYMNGFNFEEGLQLRGEIRRYVNSNRFHIYDRRKNMQLQATLTDFLDREKSRTEKICSFLKEKGLRNSICH